MIKKYKDEVSTPAYVVDADKLKRNLEILSEVERRSGAHILLAQKAFSCFCLYPLIGRYISGTTASGLYEARLGATKMGRENHIFSPAYKDEDIDEIVSICDHVVFNSVSQLKRHLPRAVGKTSIGIRINPEISTQEGHAVYDPCAPYSRLGITRDALDKALAMDPSFLDSIEGLHFHTLCEQNADDLKKTWDEFEKKFGHLLTRMRWLNLGGGHHITRDDYDLELLISIICDIRERYGVEVYLEPGEAVALNAGYLVTEVLDIVSNGMDILILDASAACHMPDVLEMPYRPPLMNSHPYDDASCKYKYRLSSATCLAGDIIGDYSFAEEIHVGDRLVFEDMAIYSMVKNNTFNGIPLPSIYIIEDGRLRLQKSFDYSDFKERLS